MSEFINNSEKRKEIIKSVLRQLHEGKSVDDVKAEFGKLASEATSAEIAAVEQMLIEEGLPVEEVQNLCDVHVAVFRESLDKEAQPESIPGHPVFTYRAENQVLARLLDEMDITFGKVTESDNPALLPLLRQQLERVSGFIRHYERKENQLFPYLEKYQFYGPSRVMWGIHDEIRANIKKLGEFLKTDVVDKQTAFAVFKELFTAMTEMIYKEEKILIPAALEKLHEEDWAAIRAEENQIGYFVVTPGDQWKPKTAPQKIETIPFVKETSNMPEIMIPLNTGVLTQDQIDLMLKTLPVDITFVDENDEVRYFSQTPDRLFPRTPAIIGRAVQNCHPASSVHTVQKILDDFRSGKRKVAEFWIKMGEIFVYIRYFAMFDEAGKYRGTLEVSQEISHIQSLQGERRLLDD
ncbi:MAG TPA: DUF438 domain-containing protein [Anaerolineaceae bacterium]|nr:DUF438 domain-containing protein [Anaerolineaceae bacterium]